MEHKSYLAFLLLCSIALAVITQNAAYAVVGVLIAAVSMISSR